MSNEIYAKEWIEFAYKNLLTAKKLYKVDHFTDIIGIELQQSLEKVLKSLIAFKNEKIPKSHKLVEISELTDVEFTKEEKILLEIATSYYKVDRYPNPNYFLPSKEEIKKVLNFTEKLFDRVSKILDIAEQEVMNG